MKKVVKSAIVLSPPEDLWGPIQEIREKYDKAYVRWMPHINLIYPFIEKEQFAANLHKVEEALSHIEPFKITFKEFDAFVRPKSDSTVFLKPYTEPYDALIKLQASLEAAFPFCNDLSGIGASGYHPHLTVGQFRGVVATNRNKAAFQSKWTPIEFTVTQIQILSRNDDTPFVVNHSVPLKGHQNKSTLPIISKSQEVPQASLQQSSELISNEPSETPLNESIESSLYSHLNFSDDKVPEVIETPISLLPPNSQLVAQKMIKWVHSQNRKQKLPKTKDKLRAATRQMCTIQLPVCDLEKVRNKLIEEGYFKVVSNKIYYLKPKPLKNLQKNNFERFHLVTEQEATQRCREWLECEGNSPKTSETLDKCLKQLLLGKIYVDQEEVIQALEKEGVIRFDGDDLIYVK